MIVKLMGLVDIACAVWIILLYTEIISWQSALWVVFYLLAKSLVFRHDINSLLDKSIVVLIVLMFFGLNWIWGTVGAGIWLTQRGILSLI